MPYAPSALRAGYHRSKALARVSANPSNQIVALDVQASGSTGPAKSHRTHCEQYGAILGG